MISPNDVPVISSRSLSRLSPMVSNNVCLNAHPEGCAASVRRQITYALSRGPIPNGPKKVLVIGCSAGYGLASRIEAAFASGAGTVGVSYERAGTELKSGTPGFYNNREFDARAREAGLVSETVMGDAFSDLTKATAIETIRRSLGQVDLVVYSLASPVRTESSTGITWQSSIKPLGKEYSGTLVDIISGRMSTATFQPATEAEVKGCVKVMGGEDWELWMKALAEARVLAPGALTVAYSYIGPELSSPIYRSGTLGKAKEHLEATAKSISASMADSGVKAYVSVNKALVTRASAVIPAIPLYVMALYRVMKDMGLHEGCVEQIDRLYRSFLYAEGGPALDDQGRVRLDDWELREDVQREVNRIMAAANQDNLGEIADLKGFQSDFLEANGFGMPGVDYERPVSFA